jgi:hypothetical protein
MRGVKMGGLASCAVLLSAICASAREAAVDRPYEGVRLVTVEIDSPRTLLAMSQIGEMLSCHPGPRPIEFLVPAEAMEALTASGFKYAMKSENVQAIVDAEAREMERIRGERGAGFFSTYRTMPEIWAEMDVLASLDDGAGAAGHVIERFDAGNSIQGLTIDGLRITTPTAPGAPVKPVFLITATQHAREWAAASTAMWIADRLARGYGSDPVATALLDQVDFRIVPVVNPDGYAYTFPASQGGGNVRLWRKNRRANAGGTFGVDLNRNWSVGWGVGGGSSGTPSSEVYRGTAAFSEPETTAIRDYAMALPNLKAHIDIHTYSQLVLGPWGYTTSPPPRTAELNPLTASQISAIEGVNGTAWIGGQASTTLYIASGVAPDWSFQTRGALAWTYELRDTGAWGFELPSSEIVPAATEAFAGIRTLAEHIQIRLRVSIPSPPVTLTANTTTPFGVTITTENSYTMQAGSALLMWKTNPGDPYTSAPLTGGPTSFTATLPSFTCGRTVSYFVQATASDGLVVRSPASGDLTACTPPCPGCVGDANHDSQVDFSDLTTELASWGMSGAPGMIGDGDFDGVVGFSDVTTTLAEWFSGCP